MNVIDYARSTEESGVRFYQEMADCAEAAGIKRIFTMLAHDEELLLEKLTLMQEHHPEMRMQSTRALDMNSIVFEKLLANKDKFNIGSDVEAYQLALDAERDVLRAYERATAVAEDMALKKSLVLITAMERGELAEIESLFNFTNAPNVTLAWGEFSNIDEFPDFGQHN